MTGNGGREISVALLGCGVVGSQVVRLLTEQADELAARIGARLRLAGVAVRRPQRHPDVPGDLLTTDAAGLVTRDDVDVVVELVGGIEPVRGLLLTALKNGKSVVSANKALLAEDGAALAAAADESGADLYYEASVAGAIPLLRPIQQSLAGDRIVRVAGIVNGTTNFILSAMASSGANYTEALEEAGRLGYAEADPTADVDGYDAASKAAILASLAFHTRVTADDVYREGIRDVTAADIAAARALGCTVKLLAICEQTDVPGDIEGRSLLSLLNGKSVPWRYTLCAESNWHTQSIFRPERSIRDDRYKLIIKLKADGHDAIRFFDLKRDPHEFTNLAGEPTIASHQQRLQQQLLEWRRRTRDPLLDRRQIRLQRERYFQE